MAKKRGKRKSKMDRINRVRDEQAKVAVLLARVYELCRGGNPFGLGEWTLAAACGPERA